MIDPSGLNPRCVAIAMETGGDMIGWLSGMKGNGAIVYGLCAKPLRNAFLSVEKRK